MGWAWWCCWECRSTGASSTQGLITTGMSDQVSWGAYIANFTYLVGIAAAAVMLVIPAYVFHRETSSTSC